MLLAPAARVVDLEPILVEALSALGLAANDDQRKRLLAYVSLLHRWNAVHNLSATPDAAGLLQQHVVDCLAIVPPLMRYSGGRSMRGLDAGTGAGLPAVVLAIMSPAWIITAVDSVGKKVAFLRQVARELGLSADVHAGRTDNFDSRETSFDVITSRALAALPALLELIHPFFGPETRAILHKGRDHAVELAESRLAWEFDVVITKSATDEAGVLLEISNLRRKTM